MENVQEIIENNFKRMMDNNPKKMCYNALIHMLDEFDKSNEIDTAKMCQWVEEKKNRKDVVVYILPLNTNCKKV